MEFFLFCKKIIKNFLPILKFLGESVNRLL